MSLSLERRYPFYLGAIVFFVCLNFGFSISENLKEILSATLTIAAIFTGFLATAKSILLSLSRQTMKEMSDSGYKKILINYIAAGIWLNLILAFYSLAGFFFHGQSLPVLYCAAWLALVVLSFSSFVRVVKVFLLILAR